ncbi:hypothetical protein BJV82DRAFT_645494 [Fennellomyces sp. T-0311]|nr:hypothetical protein BJV82DRAFT_645494 [Fennellomyces sp. T-0311]
MKQPLQTRRKSVPQRSPSVVAAGDSSVVFQLDLESHAFSPPAPHSIISTLRHRIMLERQQHQRPRLYKPQRRLVTRIKMPTKAPPATPPQPQQGARPSVGLSLPQAQGRPARIKGPCQACRETSDGCMRKAFNWPFPSNAVFNDKGRPYVYLCNKCGLRYNKSGGCVCRNCRWVLCKEEKRKALQHIAYMRRTRPDNRVDPDDDIVDFVCSPKYWACGQPWKAGWIPHGEFDEEGDVSMEDEDDDRPLFTAL